MLFRFWCFIRNNIKVGWAFLNYLQICYCYRKGNGYGKNDFTLLLNIIDIMYKTLNINILGFTSIIISHL